MVEVGLTEEEDEEEVEAEVDDDEEEVEAEVDDEDPFLTTTRSAHAY